MTRLTQVAFTTALAGAIWVFPSMQKAFDSAVSAETLPATNSILVAQTSAIDLQQIQQTIQQNPQLIQQAQEMLLQNPQLIQQLAPMILQQNPQLIQQLEENPELVRQILQQTQPLVQQLQQNPQLIQQLQQQIKK